MGAGHRRPVCHTRAWAAKIGSFDAYVFVTPEYNHGISAALKNAIDYLYAEWNNKAAAFVSYGNAGGARAVEQLRLVMAELMVADVRAQVMLSIFTDFENFSRFRPHPRHESELNAMLDQLIAWGGALKTLSRPPTDYRRIRVCQRERRPPHERDHDRGRHAGYSSKHLQC